MIGYTFTLDGNRRVYCTYRPPDITPTLASAIEVELPDDIAKELKKPHVHTVVVDNDGKILEINKRIC